MKWNTDRVVSLSAMIIGVGSLFIVIYQTALIREQQKASVLPYLMIGFNSSGEGAFVAVDNMGLGPALIDRVLVRYQGREIDGDAFAFYSGLEPEKSAAENVWVDRILPGMLVPAGSTKRMLGSTNRAQMFSELLRTFDFTGIPRGWVPEGPAPAPGQKAVLEIEYSSVYGERWRVRSDRVVPEPL